MKNKILQKILMLTKYALYGFCLLLLTFSVLLADTTFGQGVQSVREHVVNLHLTNASIDKAILEIEKKTPYRFAYDAKTIKKPVKISLVSGENKTVADYLLEMSRQSNLMFKQLDHQIMVLNVRKNDLEVNTKHEKLNITITGTVTSVEDGEGLPGVNVVVKGTRQGTITDMNGRYTLSAPDESETLVFSSVGYERQEVAIGGRSVINIEMTPDIQALQEIVVIGYGEVNKRDLTGAVGKVEAGEINELPVAGFDQAMQGKVSGVRVINSNAAPGGGFDIQIRGVGSLTSSGYPLVVVDGMPLQDESFVAEGNPFNAINPNDIESVEILKDASSAAIYGARAANGVVLITTKRGKEGKPRINFNFSAGVSQMINVPEVGNAAQFKQFYKDGANMSFLKEDLGHYNPDLDASWKWNLENDEDYFRRRELVMQYDLLSRANRAFRFMAWDTLNHNTSDYLRQQVDDWYYDTAPWSDNDQNWLNEITRGGEFPGSTQNYNISASGGSDAMSYYVSGSYYQDKGIVKETDFQRFTANVNLDFKVNNNIRAGVKISPSWQDLDNIGGSRVESRWFTSPLYQQTLMFPPIFSAYDENGEIYDYGRQSDFLNIDNTWGTHFFGNPLYQFERTDNRKTFRSLASFWGEITFLKDFTFRSSLLTDFRLTNTHQWRPSTAGDRFNSPGPQLLEDIVNAQDRMDKDTKWYWENVLSYKKTINDAHNIDAVAGYTVEKTQSHWLRVEKRNFATDDVPYPAAGAVIQDPEDATDALGQNAFIGMFVRGQYNYNSKYYLTGTFRRDGSSRFGSESLWGNFPSVAVAWRLSEEPFMQGITWLDDLKIRASYGVTGNSSIANNRQQRVLDNVFYVFDESIAGGFEDQSLFDPTLSWEKTKEQNIGLNVGLFQGRINLTVDAYKRESSNMLLSVNLPNYVGFNSIVQNFGNMENKGIEFTIDGLPIAQRDFTWNTNFNISFNRNKITKLFPNENDFIQGQSAAGNTYTRAYVGGPISLFWGAIYQGPYSDWDEVYTQPAQFSYSGGDLDNMSRNSTHPGDPKYADINGDGVINGNDQTVIGSPWPDFYWGFGNTFKYKDFDLYVQMDGIQGSHIYNAVKNEWFGQGARGRFNMPVEFLNDYWTPDNPDAEWYTPRLENRGFDNETSTAIVESGDYTAIRTIRLGYTLPGRLLENTFLQKLRFYVNVQNAFYFTEYSGFNPEGNNVGSNDISRVRNFGIDAGNYPIYRTLTFGIDLGL